MGKHVSKQIQNDLNHVERKTFNYKDLGEMATIGKSKAVVDILNLRFGGVITDSSTIDITDITATTHTITPLNHGTVYTISIQSKNILNSTQGPNNDGYSVLSNQITPQTSFPTAPNFLQNTDFATITNLTTYRGTYPSTGVYKLDGTTQVAATGNIMNKNLVIAGGDGGGGNLVFNQIASIRVNNTSLLYTSPSPRDLSTSRMTSSA